MAQTDLVTIETPLKPSVKFPLRDSFYRLRSCRSFAPTRR
jgi:hypothetical protein